MATYTLISSNVLTASAASVTFSSIPATFTDLVLKVSARLDDGESPSFLIRLNGDTASNYSVTFLRSTYNGTFDSGRQSNYSLGTGITYATGSLGTSDTFSNNEIYIPNYAGGANKVISVHGASEQNTASSAEVVNNVTAGLWRITSAITSITLLNTNPYNWVSGSSFYLYGISNA
jgi:hypothetical protein